MPGRKSSPAAAQDPQSTFREWLESSASPEFDEDEYQALMKRLSYARAGRKFTREEMNEPTAARRGQAPHCQPVDSGRAGAADQRDQLSGGAGISECGVIEVPYAIVGAGFAVGGPDNIRATAGGAIFLEAIPRCAGYTCQVSAFLLGRPGCGGRRGSRMFGTLHGGSAARSRAIGSGD